ncbi:class III signal peptide-containing protein [Methanothermobacter thermautotrophicus]|uniref:Class III signal peptide-containing protein n=1 Tax=Methanothermobacter thermautotrophicus TaxID=145262 RepID=A0A7J4MUL9_METTF|nr:class III signal peptide-containing protein [Methanothermobacter thermautotrophicus]WBF06348.1 class III signal peptide-containing protein [Methanothermobacter thermautotrophicus]HIH64286.1 class III signal peptide-containing protein [Methanothermobacter thermautotrophicus]HIH71008.1 class III signal peptide-containing protein [Methanothermobacter thermautotrophicus]
MMIVLDECGQGAAEYILLFGGVIVIAIATLLIYSQYLKTTNPLNVAGDLNSVRENVKTG